MRGNDLPIDDHIVRYVKPTMIHEDGTVDGSDFCLRPSLPDETGLSVNWLEAFGSEKCTQLAEVRRLCRLTQKPSGRFAEMNIGAVMCNVAEELDVLRIVSSPLAATECFDADPSHAEMVGLPAGDSDDALLIGDLIAQCVMETHPAVTDES